MCPGLGVVSISVFIKSGFLILREVQQKSVHPAGHFSWQCHQLFRGAQLPLLSGWKGMACRRVQFPLNMFCCIPALQEQQLKKMHWSRNHALDPFFLVGGCCAIGGRHLCAFFCWLSFFLKRPCQAFFFNLSEKNNSQSWFTLNGIVSHITQYNCTVICVDIIVELPTHKACGAKLHT